MARVKLGLGVLPIPELIQVCSEIVTKMSGNALYPAPNPSIKEMEDALKALNETYQAALYGGKTLKAEMYIAEKRLRGLMSQLMAYVQTESRGDEAKIISSGMLVMKRSNTQEPMEAPKNLTALHSDGYDNAPIVWDRNKRAKSYCIQQTKTPDVEESWIMRGISTKSKFNVTKLEIGQQYWFRVAAVGPHGQSPWSDPVKRMLG